MTAPSSNLSNEIEDLLTEFRKTCFLVASDLENEKAVELMAMTIINTNNKLTTLFNKQIVEARIDELNRSITHISWTAGYEEERRAELEKELE